MPLKSSNTLKKNYWLLSRRLEEHVWPFLSGVWIASSAGNFFGNMAYSDSELSFLRKGERKPRSSSRVQRKSFLQLAIQVS